MCLCVRVRIKNSFRVSRVRESKTGSKHLGKKRKTSFENCNNMKNFILKFLLTKTQNKKKIKTIQKIN